MAPCISRRDQRPHAGHHGVVARPFVSRHSHGGVGWPSAQSPRRPVRASVSRSARRWSVDYRRNHHANPARTISWFSLRPSGRMTSEISGMSPTLVARWDPRSSGAVHAVDIPRACSQPDGCEQSGRPVGVATGTIQGSRRQTSGANIQLASGSSSRTRSRFGDGARAEVLYRGVTNGSGG
jgi:hypothetical protein